MTRAFAGSTILREREQILDAAPPAIKAAEKLTRKGREVRVVAETAIFPVLQIGEEKIAPAATYLFNPRLVVIDPLLIRGMSSGT